MHGFNSYASHIFGGELLYTHVSGNTYKVTLTVYGDCGAGSAIFNTLYAATPVVNIYNGGILFSTINLPGVELGTEVSPVCLAEIKNTSCNGGSRPGVRKFTYSDTVSIPVKSADWAFIFNGNMGPAATNAGRSGSISNIINATPGTVNSTTIQLEADLNNTLGDNSSPAYSSIPTPFYCINLEGQYNQGAIDPDGDSIAFSLIPAVDANNGKAVSYISPYTAINPLATSAGAFSFSALNGQGTFTPNKTQNALVVCQVSEYRKGVLVGTSEREMTFVVLDNCQGTPPNLTGQNVSGGALTGKNIVNVCIGTPHLSFNIGVTNPNGDDLSVSNSALPGTATLNIANNNTPAPFLTFDWATAAISTGIYTFYLTVNDNHCPLAFKQTIAYTINVTPPPTVSGILISPTQCIHKAYMQYNLISGYLPHTLTIMQGRKVLKTYTDTTGIIKDSLAAGSYTVSVSSNPFCTTTAAIIVQDSGKLPLAPVVDDYCIGAPEKPIDITPIGNGAIITWYSSNGYPMYYPPVPNTTQPGTDTWYFTEEYQLCMSDRIRATAAVHLLPVPAITIPENICLGDTIYLVASGGVQYTWTPKTEILTDNSGKEYIRIMTPVTLQVKVADQYGCSDSTIARYKDIQYCCNFYYPNAFTPNGDGKNDGFRIISYGNLTEYHLVIFNRWGQQVFESTDQGQYWDGKFNGMPCEIGTYMYYFKGKCLTGNKEETKGDVILIR